MDDHQRREWHKMLEVIDDFAVGDLDRGNLVRLLRGLYVEADRHDPKTRAEFEAAWVTVDAEHDLRTQPWARAGAADEESLRTAPTRFTQFVEDVLAADTGQNHR